MARQACDRSWQVEAARDGRLDAEALVSFRLHLASCALCQKEQQTLERLALELCQIGARVDEMAVRRLRQRTLELANQGMLRSQPQPRRMRSVALTWVACIAVAAAAWLALVRPNSLVAPPLAVQIEPQRDTQWQRKLEQNVEHVDLSAGTLLFRVSRKASDPRLLVRVPDGEIEDLGTTFSVSVQDGKTREIVVREGRVLFHRRGAAALHLVAGSTWTAPVEPAPSAPSHLVAEPRATDALQTEPAMPQPKSFAPRPSGSARTVSRAEPPTSSAGNAEDASYLQILALLREGRSDEARLAAFAYLRMFPMGFRKLEVERVATLQNEGAATSPVEVAP